MYYNCTVWIHLQLLIKRMHERIGFRDVIAISSCKLQYYIVFSCASYGEGIPDQSTNCNKNTKAPVSLRDNLQSTQGFRRHSQLTAICRLNNSNHIPLIGQTKAIHRLRHVESPVHNEPTVVINYVNTNKAMCATSGRPGSQWDDICNNGYKYGQGIVYKWKA